MRSGRTTTWIILAWAAIALLGLGTARGQDLASKEKPKSPVPPSVIEAPSGLTDGVVFKVWRGDDAVLRVGAVCPESKAFYKPAGWQQSIQPAPGDYVSQNLYSQGWQGLQAILAGNSPLESLIPLRRNLEQIRVTLKILTERPEWVHVEPSEDDFPCADIMRRVKFGRELEGQIDRLEKDLDYLRDVLRYEAAAARMRQEREQEAEARKKREEQPRPKKLPQGIAKKPQTRTGGIKVERYPISPDFMWKAGYMPPLPTCFNWIPDCVSGAETTKGGR